MLVMLGGKADGHNAPWAGEGNSSDCVTHSKRDLAVEFKLKEGKR